MSAKELTREWSTYIREKTRLIVLIGVRCWCDVQVNKSCRFKVWNEIDFEEI